MSHPKTGICLVYKSPGRVLPRVDVVNEVLLHVGDGLQQPQPNVLGVSVGDVRELSLEAGPVPVFAGELKSLNFFQLYGCKNGLGDLSLLLQLPLPVLHHPNGAGHPGGGGLEVVEMVLASIVLQTHEDVITILTSCAAGFLELL